MAYFAIFPAVKAPIYPLKFLLIPALLLGWTHYPDADANLEQAQHYRRLLDPLHPALAQPQPEEWRSIHPETPQSLEAYIQAHPQRATDERNKIYVQLIGRPNARQQAILQQTFDYLEHFFALPVIVADTTLISAIPARAQRKVEGHRQLLTSYLLKRVLKPNLPDDAAAYVAFTAEDLYPKKSWNYVFGNASIKDRIGVWSIYRFGDPTQNKKNYQLCLMRSIKTAVHETGHIFSLRHCLYKSCVMNGSAHLEEADARPHYLCNHCVAKLYWNLEWDVVDRYSKLSQFWNQQSLPEKGQFAKQAHQLLQNGNP